MKTWVIEFLLKYGLSFFEDVQVTEERIRYRYRCSHPVYDLNASIIYLGYSGLHQLLLIFPVFRPFSSLFTYRVSLCSSRKDILEKIKYEVFSIRSLYIDLFD